MNEPLLSRAFSRGSRQSSAQPNDADPLAELARIVGEDDPFRDIFGEAQRAARPAEQPRYETPDYDPHGQQAYAAQEGYAYGAAHEAYDPAYYDEVGSESGYLTASQGNEYYDEETELGPDISLKKRRGGLVLAGIVTVAVLGGAAFAMYRGDASQTASGNPPVIHADPGPTKTVPEKTAEAAPQHSKLIYDRVGAVDKPGDEKVVSRTEEPMDLPGAEVPAPGAAAPDAAAAGTAANPAPSNAPGTDGAVSGEPRRVRTVLIRPDGSLGAPGTDAGAAPAATPPQMASEAAPTAPLAQMASAPDAAAPAASQPGTYPFSIIENDDLARPGGAAAAAAAAPSAAPAPLPPTKPPAPPAPVAAAPAPARAAPAAAPAPAPAVAAARPAAPSQNQRVASLPSAVPARPAPVASSSSAKIPAGTFTVQLTSQRSEQDALAAYAALQKRFPALLGSRQPAIQKADLGSRGIYYRVKVVAGARDAAVQLCSGLKAQGGDCIVGN